MSKIVLYYKLMIKLCNACGKYVMHQNLYDDLVYGSPPSPGSIRTLQDNHENSMDVLESKLSAARINRTEISRSIVKLSIQIGLYPVDIVFADDPAAKDFCKKLMMRDEDCDFRAKVRDWSRDELSKIKENASEPDLPLSFQDYLDKYETLREKRKKRKKRKQKH